VGLLDGLGHVLRDSAADRDGNELCLGQAFWARFRREQCGLAEGGQLAMPLFGIFVFLAFSTTLDARTTDLDLSSQARQQTESRRPSQHREGQTMASCTQTDRTRDVQPSAQGYEVVGFESLSRSVLISCDLGAV
jgi:hypothetical protein